VQSEVNSFVYCKLVPSDMQQQIHEYCSLNSDNTMNTWLTNNVIMWILHFAQISN